MDVNDGVDDGEDEGEGGGVAGARRRWCPCMQRTGPAAVHRPLCMYITWVLVIKEQNISRAGCAVKY